jgi:hypothetical protein
VTVARPLRLTRELLDRVVIARLSVQAAAGAAVPADQAGHFEYLLGCYRRLHREQRLLLGSKARRPSMAGETGSAVLTHVSAPAYQGATAEAQRAVLAHCEGIIVSYAGLVAQMPDMFPQPPRCVACVYMFQARQPRLTESGTEHRIVEKGAAVMVPFLMASAGSDFDFWTALAQRFATDGLDEVGLPRGEREHDAAAADAKGVGDGRGRYLGRQYAV